MPSSSGVTAVTPDELGNAWKDSVLHRVIEVDLNGKPLGRADAGTDATFSLARLISHAAKSRNLKAGAIIGSGTISNRDADGGPGHHRRRGWKWCPIQ